ncbi:hypothetical protein [Sphingomonas sp. IC4-52]|uniref:hypothetical protein n=1 Tax=Sphingomonas sp. IC4-52 TaxID=2887202 RepID=UPI001D114C45|nr:hypothetical protein [Sphingomonas sp. IC4-52]MCC2981079.1 hypothetical protein [Sphingomonas sp. IC4-52]
MPDGSLITTLIGAALLAGTQTVVPPPERDNASEAAEAEPRASGSIVVLGSKMKERRERANAYVRATGIARGQLPAARWVEAVCPKVGGVGPETAAIVDERIRALATEVGAPLAGPGCTPNAIVTFTNDAKGVVRRVLTRAPHQFKDVPLGERDKLRNGDAPIRWWHVIATGDADGVPPVAMQPSFVSIDGGTGGFGLPMGQGGVQLRYKEGAISSQATRSIIGAAVVIDVGRAGPGRDLRALGDYAAMVALAEFRPSQPPPSDSLLAMFETNEPASGATPNDVALLTQLYAVPLDREARAHRRMLAEALVGSGIRRKR